MVGIKPGSFEKVVQWITQDMQKPLQQGAGALHTRSQSDFRQIADSGSSVVRLLFQTEEDLAYLPALLQAFSSPDGCSLALVLFGAETEIAVYQEVSAQISSYLPVHWERALAYSDALVDVYICSMNQRGCEIYRTDAFLQYIR